MKKHLYILLILVSPIFVYSQNVGIGTTTPDFKLDIESSTDARARIYSPNSSYAGFLFDNSLQQYFVGVEGNFANSRFSIYDNTANALRFQISTTGNVGIGVSIPEEKLHVNGNLKVAGIISGVADPVSAQDAATKAYVDAATSSPTYTIGLSTEQGGYIFWVSADGKHGLVAATQDQSALSNWYNAQDYISNPANHSTNGQKFRDWRLPTKYELNEMYAQRVAIGGFTFTNVYYWSSTEYHSTNAWLQTFATGFQINYSKVNDSDRVRAVRAF